MNELEFWLGALSLLTGALFVGVGTLFLLYGQGQTGLVQIVSYLAAAFLDLSGLAMIVDGLFHWARRRSI